LFDFLFPPDVVEFVSLVDRRLTFKCKKAYKAGQTVRVKFEVPTETGPQKMQIPVVVTSLRNVEGEKLRIAVSEVPMGSREHRCGRATTPAHPAQPEVALQGPAGL
jgi:hypothetical protein